MISVFTPSHDPKYLNDCYRSLSEQTYENWEWVVSLNNGAHWEKPKDERVKVFYSLEDGRGVGFYKNLAVYCCKGDILVELDHDDMLMPEALAEIDYVFDNNPHIGFVYSDTAQIQEDGTPDFTEFRADHGWKYYHQDGFKVARSFEPYPHNLSYIWYAPNHLRAFRKSVYQKVGGYDYNLDVLDDQDLMYRLYTETYFYHIDECLYLQRVHDNNTQSVRNAEIQSLTVDMHYNTIEPLALAWTKKEKLLALDLGAHHNKPEGYLGVDVRPGEGVNYVVDFFDIETKINPGSVGVIRASDFMEHVGNDRRQAFMELCWDLLAHGGVLITMTPSSDGRGAHQDPTHNAFWNENSFWYYTDKQYTQFIDAECAFHVSSLRTFYPSDWHREHDISYVQAILVAIKEEGHDFGGLQPI